MYLSALKATEQLLNDGTEIGDELKMFSAQCKQTNDTQVCQQTSIAWIPTPARKSLKSDNF